MNRQKFNFSRRVAVLAVFSSILLCSPDAFAQNFTKISFNNFVASADARDIKHLIRPRIVVEPKNRVSLSTESAVTVPVAPNSAASSAARAFQLERQAFEVLNRKRVENGLPPLVWSESMARVARIHSQEMAQFKFFSHIGRSGTMVDERAETLGFKKWKAIGENIAYNRGYNNPAEFACERWMLSPSHRENILNARWKEAGIGVAIAPDGTHYFTEVFITPR